MTTIKNIIVLTSNIDADGDKFDVENMEFPEKVPLLEQFHPDKNIGECDLIKSGSNLLATINSPLTESELLPLYPAIQFKVYNDDVVLNEKTGKLRWKINKIELISIGLCIKPNCDESIKTIGTQSGIVIIKKVAKTKIPSTKESIPVCKYNESGEIVFTNEDGKS